MCGRNDWSFICPLIFFRYLGRRFGLLGVLHDLIIIIVEIFAAILIAGTLAFPVFGTIFAPAIIYIQIKKRWVQPVRATSLI